MWFLQPQIAHSDVDAVTLVAVHEAGRLALTGDGKIVALWDVERARILRTFAGRGAAFHGDEVWVVGDEAVHRYAAGGEPLGDLPRVGRLSPGGRYGTTYGPMTVTDPATGAVLRAGGEADAAVDWSEDGRFLGVCDHGAQTCAIWDVETGAVGPAGDLRFVGPGGSTWIEGDPRRRRHLLRAAGERRSVAVLPELTDAAWSPEGRLLTAAPETGVELRSASGKPIGHWDLPATRVAWFPDGTHALVGCADGSAAVVDVATGAVSVLESNAIAATSLALTGSDAWIGAADGTIRRWDLDTLGQTQVIALGSVAVTGLRASPDGRLLAAYAEHPLGNVYGEDLRVRLIDARSGAIVRDVPGDATPQGFAFAADGRFVAVDVGRATVYAASGEPLASWTTPDPASGWPFHAVAFAGDHVVTARFSFEGGLFERWDPASPASPVWTARSVELGQPTALAVSPDGSVIAAAGHTTNGATDGIELRDADTGALRARVAVPTLATSLAWSPDGARLLIGLWSGVAVVLDVASLEIRWASEPGTTGEAFGAAWLDDGRWAWSAMGSGVRLVAPERGGAVTLVLGRDGQWLVHDDAGRFDASRDGTGLVAVVAGTDSYGVEQFATATNRPDVLLASVGLGDPATIEHFRARWARRAAEIGLSAADAEPHVPGVRILGAEQDGRTLRLAFVGEDDRHALASWHVWANGVPVASGPAPDGEVTVDVPLATGDNEIEVAVVDAAGAESWRASARARVDGEARPRLWVLAFGVSDYADDALDLGFAHQDALDLGAVFSGMRGRFAEVHVRVLTDAEVTASAVREAGAFFAGSHMDDTVVVFAAGHGLHDADPARTYYFLSHEADLARLAETAVPYEALESLVAGVGARHRLVLLDACESGEDDEGGGGSAPGLVASSRGVRTSAARPGPTSVHRERERFVYNDVTRATGAVVVSSSRGSEVSFESADVANGFFTEEIVAALTSDVADADGDGLVTTRELRVYVARAVAERSGDRQHPTVDRDNLATVFGFPIASARKPR